MQPGVPDAGMDQAEKGRLENEEQKIHYLTA